LSVAAAVDRGYGGNGLIAPRCGVSALNGRLRLAWSCSAKAQNVRSRIIASLQNK
jgi:hypothetical protein